MELANRDVILNNITKLGLEQTEIFERRYAHLADLADLLYDEAGEEYIFFRDSNFVSAYRELVAEVDMAIPSEAIDISRGRVAFEGGLLAASSRAFICKRLTESLGITGLRSIGTYFDDVYMGDGDKISYVKGPYADEAYLRFSKKLSCPKAIYGSDFADVCKSVCYDKTEFCVLPIENSVNGRLADIRRLIIKYGLKISLITRVEDPSDGTVTVFALLKKSISAPEVEGRKYIEIRISGEQSVSSLLSVSELFGMKTVSVATAPNTQDTHDITFLVSEEICGFLTYLFLEYRYFVTTGIYAEI